MEQCNLLSSMYPAEMFPRPTGKSVSQARAASSTTTTWTPRSLSGTLPQTSPRSRSKLFPARTTSVGRPKYGPVTFSSSMRTAGGRAAGRRYAPHLPHASCPSSWCAYLQPKITRSKEEAIKILKGYRSEIDGSTQKFAELATLHSDCSSHSNGGDLGFFKPVRPRVIHLMGLGISFFDVRAMDCRVRCRSPSRMRRTLSRSTRLAT